MLSECVVAGVCVFTVAYLLRYTDGPFDIFYHFRIWVGVYADEVSVVDGIEVTEEIEDPNPAGFFAKLVTCFWCLSTWMSLAITILYVVLFGDMRIFPFMWLFATGLSGLLHEITE